MINIFEKKNLEYLANTYPLPTTYPDGMDIEIFKRKTFLSFLMMSINHKYKTFFVSAILDLE